MKARKSLRIFGATTQAIDSKRFVEAPEDAHSVGAHLREAT
jgi:hypothetical protein